MKKLLQIIKYVLTIFSAVRKEKEKKEALIHNINQIFAAVEDAVQVNKDHAGKSKYLEQALDIENLKSLIGVYQNSVGLYDAIKEDVKGLK